jgi:hypothetical protein
LKKVLKGDGRDLAGEDIKDLVTNDDSVTSLALKSVTMRGEDAKK